MAGTQLRSNRQLMDNTVTLPKLVSNFAQGATWQLSSDNTAVLTGVAAPTVANDVVNKQYVDGLVDTTLKSPDGFATDAVANYPSDYKGTGLVAEGDAFYVTDISLGNTVGIQVVNVGDLLVALVDTPTNIDANWLIMESNRDVATTDVPGIVELSTQLEADAGIDTTRVITPATLSGFITNNGVEKVAGAGLTEDGSFNFNVIPTDASIVVGADDLGVGIGGTNGASLEITVTGLELAPAITGARSFSGGTFTIDSGAGLVSITSGGTLTLDATVDNTVLSSQPTGTVLLAVATTKYVDDQIAGGAILIYSELPTVTDGSANVTLLNTPIAGTERVYLNGARQAPGATNDYTISGATVTFTIVLETNDVVLVDYSV